MKDKVYTHSSQKKKTLHTYTTTSNKVTFLQQFLVILG